MPTRRRQTVSFDRASVRVAGRDWPVISRVKVGGRGYLILRNVGHGRRGRYMAFDPYARALRALIILPDSRAARQHVRVLKRVSTGNINLPLILDFQARHGELIAVTTWITGPDLREYLQAVAQHRRARPSAPEAIRLVRGLAHGLAQLHRHHTVIHGDLKPANLVLASRPSRLVMIDYGSAWLSARTRGRADGDGLSPPYAAPELQSGDATWSDARGDQFSASVILYELLTLSLPYDNLGGQIGRYPHVDGIKDQLIPPSRRSPDRGRLPAPLWRQIDEVVATGLARDPNDRFATSGQWTERLDQVHFQLRPAAHLSRFNGRMTRVVAGLAQVWKTLTHREDRDE